MKNIRIAIVAAAIVAFAAAGAYAQTTTLGGTPPHKSPIAPTTTPVTPPAAAPSSQPASAWTKADVDNMCSQRWSGKPKRINGCIKRNSGHIGKPKTAADAQMIQTGKMPPHKKRRGPRRNNNNATAATQQ